MASIIKIIRLNDRPDYAPILAHWSYTEWYRKRDIDFDLVMRAYKARAAEKSLPATIIAICDTAPVGMVTLKQHDMLSRPELDPWLSSLFVVPEYRGRGIGEMLIESISGTAKKYNFEQLFLFLSQSNIERLKKFYIKMGWEHFGNGTDNDGHDTEIYRLKLQGN